MASDGQLCEEHQPSTGPDSRYLWGWLCYCLLAVSGTSAKPNARLPT
jgi:hypothetical protein